VRYTVTSVDKFHGPNPGSETIELSEADLASPQTLGAALRKARILVSGQRVRSYRGPNAWERGEPLAGTLNGKPCPTPSPYAANPIAENAVIVFPHNAPGLTTGLHSLTLTPVTA
jgi:hypothetical protein